MLTSAIAAGKRKKAPVTAGSEHKDKKANPRPEETQQSPDRFLPLLSHNRPYEKNIGFEQSESAMICTLSGMFFKC